jgi:hypothetical protein
VQPASPPDDCPADSASRRVKNGTQSTHLVEGEELLPAPAREPGRRGQRRAVQVSRVP